MKRSHHHRQGGDERGALGKSHSPFVGGRQEAAEILCHMIDSLQTSAPVWPRTGEAPKIDNNGRPSNMNKAYFLPRITVSFLRTECWLSVEAHIPWRPAGPRRLLVSDAGTSATNYQSQRRGKTALMGFSGCSKTRRKLRSKPSATAAPRCRWLSRQLRCPR